MPSRRSLPTLTSTRSSVSATRSRALTPSRDLLHSRNLQRLIFRRTLCRSTAPIVRRCSDLFPVCRLLTVRTRKAMCWRTRRSSRRDRRRMKRIGMTETMTLRTTRSRRTSRAISQRRRKSDCPLFITVGHISSIHVSQYNSPNNIHNPTSTIQIFVPTIYLPLPSW